MKKVWVKGCIQDHHKTLKGGSTDSIAVRLKLEDGEFEWIWVKASGFKWRGKG